MVCREMYADGDDGSLASLDQAQSLSTGLSVAQTAALALALQSPCHRGKLSFCTSAEEADQEQGTEARVSGEDGDLTSAASGGGFDGTRPGGFR